MDRVLLRLCLAPHGSPLLTMTLCYKICLLHSAAPPARENTIIPNDIIAEPLHATALQNVAATSYALKFTQRLFTFFGVLVIGLSYSDGAFHDRCGLLFMVIPGQQACISVEHSK